MKIILKKLLLSFLITCLPYAVSGQTEKIFNGIQLDDPVGEVLTKLETISSSVIITHNDDPSFPLAKDRESHLVCNHVKTGNGTIDKVIFTFADDKLCYIEARGNAVRTLTGMAKDTTVNSYMDYNFHPHFQIISHQIKDMAWIMNDQAMHVNLFAWENPYMNGNNVKPDKNASAKIPEFIKMGKSLEELKPSLEANSKFTYRMELDGSDPNAQFQIDAFGIDYLGFPRKFEARFGDNKLNVVWILTGKGEEDRIRKALISSYGRPIFKNADWEIFDNWQIGLRKDKPEILLLTQELGLQYKKDYFKQ